MSHYVIPSLRFLPQEFVGEHLLGEADPIWDDRSFAGDPPGQQAELVSSVYGHMDYLMFFLPLPKRQNSFVLKCLKDAIYELIDRIGGQQRHFVVITEAGRQEALAEHNLDRLETLAEQRGHTFSIIEIPYKQAELCIWTQDSFLPVQYYIPENKTTQIFLVESKIQSRNKGATEEVMSFSAFNTKINQDNTGLKHLPKTTVTNGHTPFPFKHITCGLPFAGGNVLAGDSFVLMGRHQTSFKAIEEVGKAWFGKNLILLEIPAIQDEVFLKWTKRIQTQDKVFHQYGARSKHQGIYHIDLFITLAGKDHQKREQFVIGEPVLGFELADDCPADLRRLLDSLIKTTTIAINQIIVSLKQQLKGYNIPYVIHRSPLPLTYYDGRSKKKKQIRTWAWASYHNCLVEQYKKDGKTISQVILPSYGKSSDYSHKIYSHLAPPLNCGNWSDLSVYDQAHYDFWESLGYQVIQLQTDFNPFAEQAGSLNCISNCIQRTHHFS